MRVDLAARAPMSESVPTASIRPPAIAIASATESDASTVTTRPFSRIRSGVAVISAWRAGPDAELCPIDRSRWRTVSRPFAAVTMTEADTSKAASPGMNIAAAQAVAARAAPDLDRSCLWRRVMKRVLAVLTIALPLAGFGADKSPDQSFFNKAAEGGIAEVDAGNLAQNKGNSQAVKDFGAMMA